MQNKIARNAENKIVGNAKQNCCQCKTELTADQ
jgi:hypothetical protein